MFEPDLFAEPGMRPDLLCEARFLNPQDHERLLRFCLDDISWRQMSVNFKGKEVPIPRRLAWFGDVDYAYSGLRHSAAPMPAPLREMADRITDWLHAKGRPATFNSVLMNFYRDGNDAISLHSDDESQLGKHATIASISLGATRTFEFRHKSQPLKLEEPLVGGSLLVMLGDTQEHWRHGIPREPAVTEPRVNLTFRHTNC